MARQGCATASYPLPLLRDYLNASCFSLALLCALGVAIATPVAVAGGRAPGAVVASAFSSVDQHDVQAGAKKKKKKRKKASCKNRNAYKISKKRIFSKQAYQCMRQAHQASQANDLLLKELQRLFQIRIDSERNLRRHDTHGRLGRGRGHGRHDPR
jgi:hypothetical protein